MARAETRLVSELSEPCLMHESFWSTFRLLYSKKTNNSFTRTQKKHFLSISWQSTCRCGSTFALIHTLPQLCWSSRSSTHHHTRFCPWKAKSATRTLTFNWFIREKYGHGQLALARLVPRLNPLPPSRNSSVVNGLPKSRFTATVKMTPTLIPLFWLNLKSTPRPKPMELGKQGSMDIRGGSCSLELKKTWNTITKSPCCSSPQHFV